MKFNNVKEKELIVVAEDGEGRRNVHEEKKMVRSKQVDVGDLDPFIDNEEKKEADHNFKNELSKIFDNKNNKVTEMPE